MTGKRVVLIGASGFVGSAVDSALRADHDVIVVKAPRLTTSSRETADLQREASSSPLVSGLAEAMAGADALVNAAGHPDASSLDEDRLFGANALLPAVLLEAARQAGVRRMVHVSSAVVQNDKPLLDASEDVRPFSPYSASKVAGEQVLRDPAGSPGHDVQVVRYRPPSVHAPGRRVTRMVARIAASPAASVARPGNQPTPQALLPNVAAAIAHLATTDADPPAVVHHPSEGVTVTGLMRDLSGGRAPMRIPSPVARAFVSCAKMAGRVHKPTAANARRVELLWLGQRQAPSWLTETGWQLPVGPEGWKVLAGGEEKS